MSEESGGPREGAPGGGPGPTGGQPGAGAGRRRSRGRRRPGQGAAGTPGRPQQAPAQPTRAVRPTAPREDKPSAPREGQAPRPPRRGGQQRGGAGGQRPPQQGQQRGGGGAQRGQPPAVRGRAPRRPRFDADDLKAGAPCVILFDCREGEPDRQGSAATFEGYFDFETGEQRRMGHGIPRLRIGEERVWGFEVWWRPDPDQGGLTDDDRASLEVSKRMLRALVRDTRRQPRFSGARAPVAT